MESDTDEHETVPYSMRKGNDAVKLKEDYTGDVDHATHSQLVYTRVIFLYEKRNRSRNGISRNDSYAIICYYQFSGIVLQLVCEGRWKVNENVLGSLFI